MFLKFNKRFLSNIKRKSEILFVRMLTKLSVCILVSIMHKSIFFASCISKTETNCTREMSTVQVHKRITSRTTSILYNIVAFKKKIIEVTPSDAHGPWTFCIHILHDALLWQNRKNIAVTHPNAHSLFRSHRTRNRCIHYRLPHLIIPRFVHSHQYWFPHLQREHIPQSIACGHLCRTPFGK